MAAVMTDEKQNVEHATIKDLCNLRERIEKSIIIDMQCITALTQFNVYGIPYSVIAPCVSAKTELLVSISFIVEKHDNEPRALLPRLESIVKKLPKVIDVEKTLRNTVAKEFKTKKELYDDYMSRRLELAEEIDPAKWREAIEKTRDLLQNCINAYEPFKSLESFKESIDKNVLLIKAAKQKEEAAEALKEAVASAEKSSASTATTASSMSGVAAASAAKPAKSTGSSALTYSVGAAAATGGKAVVVAIASTAVVPAATATAGSGTTVSPASDATKKGDRSTAPGTARK